ncbi:9831_t:CDS:1, partial [Diversispora eburnea]
YKHLIFTFTTMPRVRMRSDAPLFSPQDYSYIMQCRDIKSRYKILNELMGKYKTSTKRIYQIWRGEESNRILWDQPIPHLNDNNDDSNHDSNISAELTRPNSIGNIFHIESQVLDGDSAYPMSQRDVPMDMQSDNVSEERIRPN